jgi:hypothetical protein
VPLSSDHTALNTQRYFNSANPAVFEVEVIQGGTFSGQDTISQDLADHPDARQVTVQGKSAWLLPSGAYSGLIQVEWTNGSALVRVSGRGLDENTVMRVAGQLKVSS